MAMGFSVQGLVLTCAVLAMRWSGYELGCPLAALSMVWGGHGLDDHELYWPRAGCAMI
jgi:hypothetical protein